MKAWNASPMTMPTVSSSTEALTSVRCTTKNSGTQIADTDGRDGVDQSAVDPVADRPGQRDQDQLERRPISTAVSTWLRDMPSSVVA